MNTITLLETLGRDSRYALRQLRLHPVFTVTAVLSLALGIGANTAIFTLTDQILLRLLPVANPHELVQFRADGGRVGSQNGDGSHTFSHPAYLAMRDRTGSVFSSVTGEVVSRFGLQGGDRSELVAVAQVAGNYFDTFGVRVHRGRLLTPADDRVKNGSPVAVLQYDFWRNRFESQATAIGSTVRVNGVPFTVIGVAAPGFEGTNPGFPVNLWVPVTMMMALTPNGGSIDDERFAWFPLFARLRPGVSLAQADAAMKIIWKQRQEEEISAGPVFSKFPSLRDRFRTQVFSLEQAERGSSSLRRNFGEPLVLLQFVVGAVLLIACSNVAGLLLARAAARSREIAVRGSLGAGRGRLMTQLLVESLVLAVTGGLAGLLVSRAVTAVLVNIVVADPSRLSLNIAPDLRILAFTALLTLATTLLFGLFPAWQSSRVEPAAVLKDAVGTRAHVRLRKAFVAFQVGLSALLLIGAGLFARTLGNLRNIELGMKTENVVMFGLRPSGVIEEGRKLTYYRTLMESLAATPGVTAVGANTTTLFTGGRSDGSITIPGVPSRPEAPTDSFFNMITPGYFAALGVPVQRGRDISWSDWGSGRQLCLVNEQLVTDYLKDRNPLGIMFGRGTNVKPDFEIIGVFANSRYHDVRGNFPRQIVVPMDARIQFVSGVTVYARTQADPRQVMSQLRDRVRRVDSNLVISDMRTMDEQINLRLATERALSFLSAGFAILAAVLAVIGLYGVLAFVVARRNREIGIRVALGARRGQVIGLVLGEMAWVIAAGLAAGALAGVYCGQFVRTRLYQVEPFDAPVFLVAIAALAAASLAAAFLPAWRASRMDPMRALRPE